jgi:hypothetical protein
MGGMTHRRALPTRHDHRARRCGTLIVLCACALLASACSRDSSGPGVARVAAAASSRSSVFSVASAASGSVYEQALAYSKCMRADGISDFPDPDSGGNIDVKEAALRAGPGSDLNGNNAQFQAALKACQSLQPSESASQRHQDAAQALEWARCMRAHSISDFPDPDSSGGFHVAAIRAAGVDVTSPQFQTAATACEQYQPNGIHVPGGAGGS